MGALPENFGSRTPASSVSPLSVHYDMDRSVGTRNLGLLRSERCKADKTNINDTCVIEVIATAMILVTSHMSLVTSSIMCVSHFCSMKITEDVRRYAAEKGIDEAAAIEQGLQKKSAEFQKKGSQLYAKA